MPETHNLFCKSAIVIIARPPTTEPAVIVGAVMGSSVGNAVAIGAAASLPGMTIPMAFLSHLSPEDARNVAQRIMEAADAVEAAGGGDPIEAGAELARRVGMEGELVIPLPGGATMSDPETPPVTAGSKAGPDHFHFAEPEFLGIRTQVQHPSQSGKPPTHEAGVIGCSYLAAEDGEFRVLLNLTHADGTSLAAILDRNDYISFGDCYVQTGSALGVGAPEGRPN